MREILLKISEKIRPAVVAVGADMVASELGFSSGKVVQNQVNPTNKSHKLGVDILAWVLLQRNKQSMELLQYLAALAGAICVPQPNFPLEQSAENQQLMIKRSNELLQAFMIFLQYQALVVESNSERQK
jgi:hypothetical protein